MKSCSSTAITQHKNTHEVLQGIQLCTGILDPVTQAGGERPPYLNAELQAPSDSRSSPGLFMLCEIPQEPWRGVGDKKIEPCIYHE